MGEMQSIYIQLLYKSEWLMENIICLIMNVVFLQNKCDFQIPGENNMQHDMEGSGGRVGGAWRCPSPNLWACHPVW